MTDKTSAGSSKSRAECSHEKLRFGSGDYYIFCANLDCGARWATVTLSQLEHWTRDNGSPVGTDPSASNQGIGGTLSGQERHSLCDDCPPEGYPTDKTRCAPCPRLAPETNEPPDPTPEMIQQGIWAWQHNERYSTAEDVRATYIAMRRMEGRTEKANPGPRAHMRWICTYCAIVSGIEDPSCLGCGKPRYPRKANEKNGNPQA